MNERILELARQVWPDPNISHVNHMKFAELIVKKCMHLCVLEQADPRDTVEMGCALRIKEHFGVDYE